MFKTGVVTAFTEAYDGPVLDCPLEMEITFVMPRPKSMNRKRTPNARRWFSRKPDWDNLGKITDVLNGVAWRDDSLLCRVTVDKVYGNDTEAPHADITIRELPASPPDPHYDEPETPNG